MADLQPQWAAEASKFESGPENDDLPDVEVINRFSLLVREMLSGIEGLCGDR